MDPLPLIPTLDVTQNAAAILREGLQVAIDGHIFPNDVFRNFMQNKVDEDLKFKENAERVLEISEKFNEDLDRIEGAERDVMNQQGRYLIAKDEIEDIVCLKERLKLKHCRLFRDLKEYFVEHFGLLQKKHLLPDLIRQFLDYKLNEGLHLCEKCTAEVDTEPEKRTRTRSKDISASDDISLSEAKTFNVSNDNIQVILEAKGKACSKRCRCEKRRKGTEETERYDGRINLKKVEGKSQPVFIIQPDDIEFHNYEVGKTYKTPVKIINVSSSLQQLRVAKFPNLPFSLQLKGNPKLAAGMSATAVIVFKPEIYLNSDDYVSFRNNEGNTSSLFLVVTRDIPRLIICIFKPISCLLETVRPGTKKFVEKRRKALNYTIDCGSCLVGEYLALMVFVQNKGMDGKFFIITEDEWFFQDITNVSSSLELSTDNFWVYPAFFELNTDDMIQINILFQPALAGLSLEKFYMICDNNSFEQLEILGDSHEFTKNYIRIDVSPDINVSEIEDYCITLGTARRNTAFSLTFTVYNNSPIFLKSIWKFQNKYKTDFVFQIERDWVTSTTETEKILPPHSITDFDFTININADDNGYHSIFFSFIIEDIPIVSLKEDEEFLMIEKEELTEKMLTKCVDIQIAEMEVACFVSIGGGDPGGEPGGGDPGDDPPCVNVTNKVAKVFETPPRKPKLAFTSHFLDFGILPSGINVQKEVFIGNLTDEYIKWRIMEIKYNIDGTPYMEIIEERHISRSSGQFHSKYQEEKIVYKIVDKEPGRWVSLLLLASIDKYDDNTVEIEAICIVIYEIVSFDIDINTGHTKAPILCPLKLMYVGVPTTITFTVENYSPITGCFCFSKLSGADLEKIDLQISPRGGVLRPMETKEITVKMTCKDVGIFENAFVKCFVGKNEDPIVLRVLCAVDGFHAYFYLPTRTDNYRKIMWPPKVVYEYDEDWMICPCTMEYGQELELSYTETLSSTKSYGDLKAITNVENNDVPSESLQIKYDAENKSFDMVEDEMAPECYIEESVKGSLASSSSGSLPKKDLMGTLEEQFGADIFLQEYFAEMHQVPLRTPTQLTFYFENVTPIETTFTVEAANFSTNKKFDAISHKFKLKKLDDIWNEMIMNDHGMLVQSDVERGNISDSELIRVNLIVYATTWGIYAEEIVVDIPNIPCFTFSLLIEVIGNPIVFPMALNAITSYPTVRFGKISYCSDYITRGVQIVNTACVPICILWHTFLTIVDDEEENTLGFSVTFDVMDKKYLPDEARIILMDKYYGRETTEVYMIDPEETVIDANSTRSIELVMKPSSFPVELDTTEIKGFVVGHIFLEELHRSTEADENPVRMEISAMMELPVLTLDSTAEDAELFVYANDVIFRNKWQNNIKLRFQNNNLSISKGYMEIDEPFEIEKINGKNKRGFNNYNVKPQGYVDVTIICKIDHQKILDLSKIVYEERTCRQETSEGLPLGYSVNSGFKMLHIEKSLRIRQNRAPIQAFPLNLFLYFPHIVVKPAQIKFDSVLLGETKKILICVYNFTGCLVKFEIYKSLVSDEIFVTPHYGEIAKSTGVNKQFTNIFIYFTPRQCRPYQESIRIVTNIPNYYIEVPIKGTGSFNEKFYVDYKI